MQEKRHSVQSDALFLFIERNPPPPSYPTFVPAKLEKENSMIPFWTVALYLFILKSHLLFNKRKTNRKIP